MVKDRLLPMFKLPLKYAAATKAKSGFSLVELLIVTAIFAFVFISFFSLLSVAQSNFFNVDTGIDIRNNLRMASEKMALELRNSGCHPTPPFYTERIGRKRLGYHPIFCAYPVFFNKYVIKYQRRPGQLGCAANLGVQ